jgi:hypothetical protein
VKMSHRTPGLNILEPEGTFAVEMGVKNWGRTPAVVTDILLKAAVLPTGGHLPVVPDYSINREPQDIANAFLVAGEEIFLHQIFDPVDWETIRSGTSVLYLFGYVDYMDQFNQRHRGGYARLYDPDRTDPSNNLVFVTQTGYNYDHLRLPGGGNDWTETAPS